MRSSVLYAFIISLSVSGLRAQPSSHIVISEIASQGSTGGSDEFVELYNPSEDETNLDGWRLQYKPSSGTFWTDKAIFTSTAIIPAHGFFLIANTSFVGPDTADFLSSRWTSGSGVSAVGHFRIVDPDSLEIDRIGYGAAAADPEGSPAPGQSLNGQSIERKALALSTADSLAAGGLHYIAGNGYDSDNNSLDFILQTHGRNPQTSRSVPEPEFGIGGNGTGSVTVSPAKVFSSRRVSLAFTIAGDAGYPLTRIKLIVPSAWSWTRLTADVHSSGAGVDSATISISGDTIDISNAAVTPSATALLTLDSLLSPASSALSTFRCFTGVAGGVPAQVLIPPRVQVNAVVPIVSLHVNNSQGVPTSPYGLNAPVTITGTVTANLSDVQTNVFIQDQSGGLNLFSFSRPIDFELGDSVLLTGSILQFRGLTEVSPDFSTLMIVDTGRALPEPALFTCQEVSSSFLPDYSEPNEGRLVRINGVSYNLTDGTITDQSGSTKFFASFPINASQFDVIGILKQFKSTTSPPFTADYEIQPRFEGDILPHPGPVILIPPRDDSIYSDRVRIAWTTDVPSTTVAYFGATSSYTDSASDPALTTNHVLWLAGLVAGTIYHYGVASEDSNGRVLLSDFLFCSASPAGSTGQINVYFTKSVNITLSLGENAAGNQDLVSRLVQRFNEARRSIDACFYNLSSSPGASIAGALVAAKNRGVLVRVIAEVDNSGNAPFTTIASNGIPFIADDFDPANGGSGLMHNKFAVIDARGGASESTWVWTGSWNPSDPGTNNDRQNAIELQDVSLARAYTAEFEEMWGSTTQSPNASVSRFGSRKLNNTPHRFNLNGVYLESYFSPSDRTTTAIAKTLSKGVHSISEAMYTFTRRDLADTLVAQKLRGRKVRVVLDNNTDTGTQYATLLSGGVDVRLKGFGDGLLHHKYAIVDATHQFATQWTITGSHNWSNAAENSNNENTLILENRRVANLYLQEFYARYLEAGGSDPIILDAAGARAAIPAGFALDQNYPNPFNPVTNIEFRIAPARPDDASRTGGNFALVRLKVYDVLGKEIATLVDELKPPGAYTARWDASGVATGVYYYRITAGKFISSRRMILTK